MFTREGIKKRVKEQPFKPFRVITSGGQSYEVLHPELILVGPRECTIGMGSPKNPATFDDVCQVSILHITALEDIPLSKPNADDNGQG